MPLRQQQHRAGAVLVAGMLLAGGTWSYTLSALCACLIFGVFAEMPFPCTGEPGSNMDLLRITL